MRFPKPSRIKNRKLLDEIKKEQCIVCGNPETDPAHLQSVGAGGGDTEDGVIPLCRIHHKLQHQRGHYYMCVQWPRYKTALHSRGWKVEKIFGIWKLMRSK